uniref:Zygote arrest 1 like n=1 Tax=Rousettus aegyptiacus TaxID=9407 RepID=A0A7J8E0J9_ROUAE|nr:zygote arrest 1 like [Rousettus aegyptiacus]
MERFVRVPYGLYQGTQYGNTLPWGQPRLSEHKQRDWRQNTGTPTFLARPGLLVPTPAPGYCTDPYKGSQLKAILARMNPSLSLRLCKANTKEVGVQVSPRVDRSVQCSLGPRTLHSRFLWDNAGHRAALPAWGVYSAVTGRRGSFWPRKDWGDEGTKVLSGPVEASQQQQQQPPPSPPTPEAQEKLGEEDAQSPGERKSQQFLERKYGYFHCKDCKIRWESAYVWCISGTNKVYFKQLCCKCQKSFNPYRVEAIQCQTCSKSRCSCPRKKRHIDLRKPHRQELCGRCKDKRFSCGNMYSFKCIL